MPLNPDKTAATEYQPLLRVFRLIRLLMLKPAKTSRQLAERLQVSVRTVQRYLTMLEELDYPVEKDFENRYFFTDDFGREVKSTFSIEEARLLKDLLLQAATTHPLRDPLLRKLFVHSDLKPLADSLLQAHTHRLVHELARAIEYRQRVVLHNYHSANTGTVTDRLVEPLSFTENYTLLNAWEVDSGQEKTYKLERIETVTRLEAAQTHPRESTTPDLFGMTGPTLLPVHLRLNHRAYRLMLEEYPLSKPFLRRHNGQYYFEGTVQNVAGIGRFVLGLCGEIEVLSPPELKAYLNERVRGVVF